MNQLHEKLLNTVPGTTSKGVPGSTGTAVLQHKMESEEKYKELNVRLRRLLAEEKKALQSVRQNYAGELKIRTDMEMLLRQCVEDVRKEIARRYVVAPTTSITSPYLICFLHLSTF